MGHNVKMAIADRFAAYVGELTKVVGHADRAGPLRDYCSGLLAMKGRRRNGQPDGGGDRAGSGFGAAPKAAAFRRECNVVG